MNEFKFDPKKLEEISAELTEAIKKFEEVKADYGETGKCVDINEFVNYHCSMVESLTYTLRRLQEQMSYMSESFYDHVYKGHLPPINSQSQMSAAIKALKLDDEYDVRKRVIYANNKNGPLVFIGKDVDI